MSAASDTRAPVAVLMAVHDGASWLPRVLAGLEAQVGCPFTLTVWDNASTDDSVGVVKRLAPAARVVHSVENIGFWAAIERLAEECAAPVFLALTDVELAPDYLALTAAAFADPEVGAVQGKLLQTRDGARTTIVDTVGFRIERDRRVTIAGHGEPDDGDAGPPRPIFAVEGAAPVFRTDAFRAAAVEGHVVDPSFRSGALGYGDDLDVAWRLGLFGWRQLVVPAALAWHERSTTTDTATGWRDHAARIPRRRAIPVEKRVLDWVNVRCARLKNDRGVRRDLLPIARRELVVLLYMLVAEPRVLVALPRFARLVPTMLRQRRIVQARARTDLAEWFR